MPITIPKPEIVGRVKATDLSKLQDLAPRKDTEVQRSQINNLRLKRELTLDEHKTVTLWDAVGKQAMKAHFGPAPHSRYLELVAFDTRTVAGRAAQRGGHWHLDDPGSYYGVASALPTEFVIGSTDLVDTTGELVQLLNAAPNLHPNALDPNLDIFQGEPYEVVHFSSIHPHRSAKNPGSTAIDRSLLVARYMVNS